MKILIGLLVLSFIVFFHEFGHFIFAKLFKVKVLSFSIGMGPIFLHKTVNETDYRLSLLPFGGYCGMEGENDFRKALEEKLDSVPKTPGSLYAVHPLKRAMIAFAGPMFNFILAIIAFSIINMVGYKYSSYKNYIMLPEEEIESPARDAGLQNGDKIVNIDGEKIENFRDIQINVALKPKEVIHVQVERNGELLNFEVKTLINKEQGNGILGVYPASNQYDTFEAKTYSFFPAIFHGFLDTVEYTKMTVESLAILFKGVDISKVVAGPARITSILGDTMTKSFKNDFRIGLHNTLSLLGMITISLGFMNLLPIPVLDGGLILFSLIALIFRKEISPRVQIIFQNIGLAILLCLFTLGLYGDVNYFIERWSVK